MIQMYYAEENLLMSVCLGHIIHLQSAIAD